MITPATKSSLYQDIINQLINEIKRGSWKPGDKFPGEKELALTFEVSRNSIRESLKSLQILGIIHSSAGKGTFVTENALRKIENTELVELLTDHRSSLIDFLHFRMALEAQAAFLAAQNASAEEIEILESLLETLGEKLIKDKNYALEGFEFHMLIVTLSQNKYIIKLFQSYSDELKAQRTPVYQDKINKQRTLEDHVKIVKAIKEAEPEKARDAMFDHFLHAFEDLNLN
ncbi:FadR/GntR family transcriptional regulator [uncultured Planococcus sp.]|uniref:FadR/GntR family transcriptional regulator n=1 Tax=uncultured Planococcus sp. TaxID=337815 RepID=UPI0026044D4B|nr:FadR/GntR family transcriptional regulator [uncultured Planococcus sp.]